MEALEEQKEQAAIEVEEYYRKILNTFDEIGVPRAAWEGHMASIWDQMVTFIKEVRKRRGVSYPSSRMLQFGRG